MNWESLLSLKRLGDTNKRLRIEQNDLRLGFEVDYDRIVFSHAFRSLQDKTQVIPFSKTDFVHTRLTHSLEVSVVGRSLGRIAGKAILEKHPHLQAVLGYQPNDFGAITAAAALAHDIGNPPFGHSGEKAIGHFFSQGDGLQFKSKLGSEEFQDLCDFEGNANGLKILTQSSQGVPGGLRLSYATLGAFIKYPKGSLPIKPSFHVADKKFGYFQSQAAFVEELADELTMKYKGRILRHPLTFLVEAADDICYTIIDFEDGINLGWIPEEYALEYLINLVRDRIDSKKYAQLEYKSQRLSYLRALAINSLIEDAVRIFIENENDILNGTFDTSLLDRSKYKAQIDDIIKLSVKNIYRSKEVVQKEVVGHRAISTLLEHYTAAGVRTFDGTPTVFDKLILSLVPEGTPLTGQSLYGTLLNVSCFVASLSDGKALRMAQDIGS
jgi:dGTPase